MYDTSSHISIASSYGCDVYANSLDKLLSKTTPYKNIIFHLCGTWRRYPFWYYGIPTKITQKPFCTWLRMFNTFVPTCAVALRTRHGKNKTCKCNIEGFIPVTSLYGVVRSPSLFIRSLIGINKKMWYDVYNNEKWIEASKTIACTIR